MDTQFLLNNLWVIIAALLVFIMTVAVGFLEIGELGKKFNRSLLKTLMISGISLVVMAIVGFNTAFAPTIYGIIGNPFYYNGSLLFDIFSRNPQQLLTSTWWSMAAKYFGTGLYTSTYFLFETAFASVTLALVGVVVLKKVKLTAFMIFAVVYFIFIWNMPAAWIWNPTGWLYKIGMRDFAGGLVVHGAAGAAGLAILVKIHREEKRKKIDQTSDKIKINNEWLTIAILLLLMGWFGFNPGSVLAFNSEALMVVITTFLAAATAMLSLAAFTYIFLKRVPNILDAVNGTLMGLIIITPLAGYVSPGSAIILGFIGGPLYIAGEKLFYRIKWIDDPIGLLPGHWLGGIFGVLMIGFFTQRAFAVASGGKNLPNGLFFNGGLPAVYQLGTESLGILAVMLFVFSASYLCLYLIGKVTNGITI
ncbi:MAG: ammonium transporter [Ferroplasma sp.]